MINILISCSGGFSSSLVISKVKKAAQNKGLEVNTWAINCADIEDNVSKADILLIAPQIQYELPHATEVAKAAGIPCLPVSQADYGRCNGEHILETVLEALNR